MIVNVAKLMTFWPASIGQKLLIFWSPTNWFIVRVFWFVS